MPGFTHDNDDVQIKGATDGTLIGNVGDRLKVDSIVTIVPAASTFGTVLIQSEVTVSTKVETDLPSGSRTIAAGKTLVMTSLSANYDTQAPTVIRVRKQTGGVGAFTQVFRLTLRMHGQDQSHVTVAIPYGIVVATATDVIKITYETSLAKGLLWAGLTGVEY